MFVYISIEKQTHTSIYIYINLLTFSNNNKTDAKIGDFGASSGLFLPELRIDRISEHIVGNPTWLAPEVSFFYQLFFEKKYVKPY